MVGWYHWLNGHEFEQTLGDSEGQASLVCLSPCWGYKESNITERLNNNRNACVLVIPKSAFRSFNSVQFSCSVVCDYLQPHGLQHTRLPCPSSSGACSNSCPLSQWYHPTISSSVIPFSSCLQSFPASGSFPVTQFFTSGGQSIGVSASVSVLPINIQGWLL